jgi:7-carboxy-7-deazaguanine synthase
VTTTNESGRSVGSSGGPAKTCVECGNDLAVQGYRYCQDCLEAGADPRDTQLIVSEVFGPTFQGEGPHTGVRTGFVRLGLCNLSCQWCDTAYTWDRDNYSLTEELTRTRVGDVVDQLAFMDVDTVCVSGGEPLIHHKQLQDLFIAGNRYSWHAETNGTIAPPSYWRHHVTHTSVSPKINTHDPLARRIRPDVLMHWNMLAHDGLACFKFVAADPGELELIERVCDQVGIEPRHVWVMPLGTDPATLAARHQELAPAIEDHGWNTTTRLHVLLYGQERRR